MRHPHFSPDPSTRPSHVPLLLFVFAALTLRIEPARGAIVTWDGGGENNNWSAARNWVGDSAPAANDSLVFDGFARLSPSNDLAAATAFNGVTFGANAGAFILAGNSVTLEGNIVDQTAVLTQTINLPLLLNATRSVQVTDNGSLTMGGAISGGTSGLTKLGNGLLTLSGANTFGGSLTVNAGIVSVASDANLGAAPGSALPTRVVLDGGTLRATSNFAINANRGMAIGAPTGSGFGTIDVVSGATLTYAGVIANNGSGAGGLTKTSFGSLTLSGANTYTGPTLVKVGTLTLDFAQSTSPAANIISPTSALTLGGSNAGLGGTSFAALTMTGGGGNNAQTFNGTAIDIGPAIIRANSGGGGSATLNLGALSHTRGGVVNFVRPTSGAITTTTPNTNGTLGGWATVGTGATVGAITVGNEWAAVDGSGNIVPYSGHVNYVSGSNIATLPNAATANVRINNGSAGNVTIDAPGAATTTDINSLQFSEAAGRSIVIGAGNTLRLGSSGGIFRSDAGTAAITWALGTSTGGANGVQNEGTLTAGGAPNTAGELVFTINAPSQTAGSLNVEVLVTDNGTGAVSVVKAGPGSMKFRGNNTYSGGTYILQGRFQLAGSEIGGANPDGWGTGPIFVMPGAQAFPSGAGTTPIMNNWFLAGNGISDNVGAIRLSNNGDLAGTITLIGDTRLGGGGANAASGGGGIISGKITGPFNLDFGAVGNSGGGHNVAILRNPANDWTGHTTIVGRTGGAAGNTRLVIGANEVVPHGVGKGNLIIGNAGNTTSTTTLDLNGFNETINGLSSAGTAALGFVQNNAFGTTSTLSVGDYDQTSTFDGLIQDGVGTVGLTKIGAGILTLTAANSYTGETNINNGTLLITGAAGGLAPAGVVKVNGAAAGAGTLAGTAPVGNVTVAANAGLMIARIAPGGSGAAGSIGTLTLESLTMNGGDLQFDLTTPASSDRIDVTGNATFAAPSTISPGPLGAAGTYTILAATGGLTLTVLPTVNPPANTRSNFALDTSSTPNSVKLVVTGGPKSLVWTGASNSTWDLVNSTNWSDGAVAEKFFSGDAVTFSDGPGNRNITLSTSLLPGGVTINNGASNEYTISGGGAIAGSTGLTKSGSGTVIIATNNDYSGSTTINAGTLQVGAGGSEGALGAGPVINDAVLAFNRNNPAIVPNVISGSGELRKIGSGTLTLSGVSNYTGPTSIVSGTVVVTNATVDGSSLGSTAGGVVNIASDAALDLAGSTVAQALNFGAKQFNIAGSGVGGTGVLTNSGAISQFNTFQQVALTANATVGGTGRFDIRGAGSNLDLAAHTLTKRGPNQFSLVGTTATDGNIVVEEGIFAIEAGTTLVDNGSGTKITFNNGTTAQFFNLGETVMRPFVLNGNVTMGNASAQASTLNSNITLNGDLTVTTLNNSTGGLTLAGNITESGGARTLSKTGPTVLTLLGNNAYSGPTHLNGGLIEFSALNNLGTNPVLNFAGGGLRYAAGTTVDISTRTLTFNAGGGTIDTNGNEVTFANPIGNNGAGGFTKSGEGMLTLTAANTYSGPTSVNGEVLLFSALNQLGSGSAINFGGGTLRYGSGIGNVDISARTITLNTGGGTIDTNGNNVTFANSIGNGGAGGLSKTGAGTLLLNANNSYGGATSVLAGTLRLGVSGALPGGTALSFGDLNTGSTGILDLGGFNATVGGLVAASGATANIVGNSSTTADSTLFFATGTSVFEGKIQDALGNGTRKVGVTVSSGSLTLAGENSFSGPTTIEGGTLQIGAGGVSGSLGATPGVANNGTLAFNRTDNIAFTPAITGSGAVEKMGVGTVTLGGANTYAGSTTIREGTVLLTGSVSATSSISIESGMLQLGAANRIADAAALALNGGVFNSNGFSETLGQVTLNGSGRFELGTGASTLRFADSSASLWFGDLLISNWNGSGVGGGVDQLIFGNSNSALTAEQLALMRFVDPFGPGSGLYNAAILPTGEVVAIPEPQSAALLLAAAVLLLRGRKLRKVES